MQIDLLSYRSDEFHKQDERREICATGGYNNRGLAEMKSIEEIN